jgi:hypothetical protein
VVVVVVEVAGDFVVAGEVAVAAGDLVAAGEGDVFAGVWAKATAGRAARIAIARIERIGFIEWSFLL